MNQIPKPGEFYKSLKDKMYQIVAVATYYETEEPMVVYQALYGNFSIYVRSLDRFLSEMHVVEKVEQTEKVEPIKTKVEPVAEENQKTEVKRKKVEGSMMEFLDARTDKERLEILDAMKNSCTKTILQNLAISQDIKLSDGDVDQQFFELRKCIVMRMKYESKRLRE